MNVSSACGTETKTESMTGYTTLQIVNKVSHVAFWLLGINRSSYPKLRSCFFLLRRQIDGLCIELGKQKATDLLCIVGRSTHGLRLSLYGKKEVTKIITRSLLLQCKDLVFDAG